MSILYLYVYFLQSSSHVTYVAELCKVFQVAMETKRWSDFVEYIM